MRAWQMWILALIILSAFLVGTYSIHHAAETGDRSRQALCNVLIAFRAATIKSAREAHRSPDQMERMESFWRSTIKLVDGCQIPKGV